MSAFICLLLLLPFLNATFDYYSIMKTSDIDKYTEVQIQSFGSNEKSAITIKYLKKALLFPSGKLLKMKFSLSCPLIISNPSLFVVISNFEIRCWPKKKCQNRMNLATPRSSDFWVRESSFPCSGKYRNLRHNKQENDQQRKNVSSWV